MQQIKRIQFILGGLHALISGGGLRAGQLWQSGVDSRTNRRENTCNHMRQVLNPWPWGPAVLPSARAVPALPAYPAAHLLTVFACLIPCTIKQVRSADLCYHDASCLPPTTPGGGSSPSLVCQTVESVPMPPPTVPMHGQLSASFSGVYLLPGPLILHLLPQSNFGKQRLTGYVPPACC